MDVLLIIGLGNPGKEYEHTRHNAGRDAVAALAATRASGVSCQQWTQKRKFYAEISECTVADKPIVLAKPTTYMNESGKSAAALAKNLKLTADALRLVVIHDDLDLPVGLLRLSTGGSSGGQKGVQSIIAALGTDDFLRLRIGIGPNETTDGHRIPAEKFVLEKFRKEERPTIDVAIVRAVEAITILLRDGLPAAQQFANYSHK